MGDTITVVTQRPKPAKLAVWDDYGEPVERVPADDSRWSFQGDWTSGGEGRWGPHAVPPQRHEGCRSDDIV